MKNLDGKVALVTGGGRGIGRATAPEQARCGADVAVVVRNSGEISTVAAAVEELGRRAHAQVADLSGSTAAAAAVPAVARALEPIGILVNNAGLSGHSG